MTRERFDLPGLGESVDGATIIQWLVATGDTVDTGTPIVEVETEKVTLELPAPWSGTLV